jgi:hypothetical protein
MHLSVFRSVVVGFSILVAPAVSLAQQPAPPDVLKTAGDYVLTFAEELSMLEAEELTTQHDTSSGQIGGSRRVRSDFVLIGLDEGHVAAFRDAFEIDGQPLRERKNRLTALLRAKLDSAALDEARALSDASVKQYISPNLHVLDDPTLPFVFLRKENQERFAFRPDGVRKMDGSEVAILRFTEQGTERMIPSPEKAPLTGRLWIEPATGAVRQAEISVSGKSFNLRSTVKYAKDQKLDLWLPSEVVLNSDVRGAGDHGISNMGAGGGLGTRQTLEARTNYSNYRQVGAKSDR